MLLKTLNEKTKNDACLRWTQASYLLYVNEGVITATISKVIMSNENEDSMTSGLKYNLLYFINVQR